MNAEQIKQPLIDALEIGEGVLTRLGEPDMCWQGQSQHHLVCYMLELIEQALEQIK